MAINAAPTRVVQWATGNIGTKSLRGLIEHPTMSLVGVYVHSEQKAGTDAGELCGLAPIGVAATNSIDDVIALEPDCVVYMPAALDVDEVCRLLAAGINVVTTRGEFHHPREDGTRATHRRGRGMPHGEQLDSQHRQQPGIHHRSRSAGAGVDSATPGQDHDR